MLLKDVINWLIITTIQFKPLTSHSSDSKILKLALQYAFLLEA